MPLTPDDVDRAGRQVITALAGPGATLRSDQRDAVLALVVEGRRALVVQPTGWGKSGLYFTAARALRDGGHGPVLVVSPLLSLMRDQVLAASRAGLRAVTLNSSNVDDWAAVLDSIVRDEVDLLLVSPERLAAPSFAPTLKALSGRLGLLVIDEAHCLSDWGSDFRPDYLRIARLLIGERTTAVLATTATANDRVTSDVARILGEDTYVQRGELSRESLHLSVMPALSALERYAYVDQALGQLEGSGIVYVLTVAETERLTGYLRSRGHDVLAYSGQMDVQERERVEDALKANDVKAVIATSALGMGFDKPDLSFCLHVGSPASPIAYYQQIGRAGRAIDRAVVALLPSDSDERLWDWFATASIPDPAEANAVLAALADGQVLSTVALETSTGARRSRIESLCKILAVDGAIKRTEGGWQATGQPWVYDHAKYSELVQARKAEAGLMRAYASADSCLDGILRRALSDPVDDSYRCGRCSTCTGRVAAGLPTQVDSDMLDAARAYLRSLDTVLDPRRQFPSGMATFKGRIGSDVQIAPGRAIAFADDPAWQDVVTLLTGPDQEAPDWLVDAVVAVLARWSRTWDERPTAVAAMPSGAHTRLLVTLAARIAEVGRLELIEPVTVTGPAPEDGLAPAARARALEDRFSVTSDVPAGPVLLVDDTWRTGWTMHLAGARLRQAGARSVLPLVLHQLP